MANKTYRSDPWLPSRPSRFLRFATQPVWIIVALLCCASFLPAAELAIAAPDSPRLRFAIGKLESALQQRGDATKRRSPDGSPAQSDIVVLIADGAALSPGPEGFSLAKESLLPA